MKNLCLLILILFHLKNCLPGDKSSKIAISDEEDIICKSEDDKRKRKYIDISKLDKIELGMTTEKELYEIFSRDINIRLSFDPVLQRKHFGKYKPVDKKIV